MPFAILIIGVFLLIAGVRNTQDTLFSLVKGDFSGDANFFYWFISIMLIGALGYVPKLKPISNAFLVLVIIVLFLKKGDPKGAGGGFFAQFSSAIGATQQTQTATTTNATPSIPDQLSALSQHITDLQQQLQATF